MATGPEATAQDIDHANLHKIDHVVVLMLDTPCGSGRVVVQRAGSPMTDDQLPFTRGHNDAVPRHEAPSTPDPSSRTPAPGPAKATTVPPMGELDVPLNEYEPGTTFPGVIGRTTEESSPAWPRPLRADAGSPNVLFIVLDDVGYGQLGCYGSPIATPNLDALAAGGLLYSNMHTTALCSPSRSCIITGRNHHANATAAINELATGYPGYNGRSRSRTGSCRRCCSSAATAPTWSASTT